MSGSAWKPYTMKTLRRFAALCVALLLAACVAAPTAPAPAPAARIVTAAAVAPATAPTRIPVLLVSIDGFRPDDLDRGLTPTLDALAADGVRAVGMQASFPTLTFPNHYTLVTGLYPDHHGIVANTMDDPALGRFTLRDRAAVGDARWWDAATPVWVSVERAGLHSATMFWPGSEAAIQGVRPDHWRPYDGKVTPDQRVDTVLHWLDLPSPQRPVFLTLYFDQVDHAAHAHGPRSAEVNAAIAEVDAALGRLVQGLRQRGLLDRVNLVIVSDHGFASTSPRQLVVLDRMVPAADVEVVSSGAVAGINPRPGHVHSVERALLGRHAHMRCWRRSALPARLHYGTNPRVPAIVCLAQDHWMIVTRAGLARRHGKVMPGDHGYDNAQPDMQALFLAHGPAFRAGIVLPVFPNVDVYPLLMHLLALPPQPGDGTLAPLRPALRPSAESAIR